MEVPWKAIALSQTKIGYCIRRYGFFLQIFKFVFLILMHIKNIFLLDLSLNNKLCKKHVEKILHSNVPYMVYVQYVFCGFNSY